MHLCECAGKLEWVEEGGQTAAFLQDVGRAGEALQVTHHVVIPTPPWDLDGETPHKGRAIGPKRGLGEHVMLHPNKTAASTR